MLSGEHSRDNNLKEQELKKNNEFLYSCQSTQLEKKRFYSKYFITGNT